MKLKFDFFWRESLLGCSKGEKQTAQAVLGAAFFSTFGVGAFTFAMSVNAQSSGLSPAWLGLAFSGYFLARLILAPLAGYGADFVGPIPLLLAATGAGTFIPALYSFSQSPETLGIIQICLGFCSGIVKPVTMSLLGGCVPKNKRGRLFGAYNTCLYTALILGPLAGGLAINIQKGIGPLSLALPGIGMGFTFLFFIRAKATSPIHSTMAKSVKTGAPWRNLNFLALLLAVMGRTVGSSVIITFLPRLINERFGLSGIIAGILFALPNIAIILGMPLTSRWADIRDKTGLTFLGMGICAACLFGFGLSLPMWGFACLAVTMGLGSALSLPASMSLAADMGSAKGSIMGIFLGAANLGFVIGPSLAGFAAENGSMTDAFELSALFSGLCLLPTFVIMSKKMYAD
ncbi:MFS transporter [Desulfovibrio gilichinskyi]|uniref:Predicted arabinose efflux permease, MFS family n=1 Tax=Desulfovibrio gilichinskyi TaxID=1519643 RepID=A0A1X7DRG7_9BACT|nr:MFS transporter [Desulfovibrio gilichinskyi]SMF20042.1 Predicted arabinose efflux permease, MFS family [Desulfovibrio gilichinskyi]